MKSHSPLLFLALCLVSTQAWALGAKRPEKPAARTLKKIVALGLIDAKPIMSQSGTFDFEEAVNRQFSAVAAGSFVVRKDVPPVPGMCLPSSAQLKINGSVLGFELTSSGGASFGYNEQGTLGLVGGGVELKVQKSIMTMVLEATDATETSILAAARVKQEQKETNLGIGVDFGALFRLGFDYYSKTPLSKVASKALESGIKTLFDKTKKIPWEAQALYQDRQFVSLNAGQDAGVRVGDEFLVQNRVHYWQGEPCKSAYLGSRIEAAVPAVVKVYQVTSTTSWAEIEDYQGEIFVRPGALVTVRNLPAKIVVP